MLFPYTLVLNGAHMPQKNQKRAALWRRVTRHTKSLQAAKVNIPRQVAELTHLRKIEAFSGDKPGKVASDS
jgi:hypothetical protein